MKLRIPAAVYKENWSSFMAAYSDTADLESKLEKAMEAYNNLSLTDGALAIIRKREAQKIADACKKSLTDKKDAIERIEAGEACLGYTTAQQENAAMRELIERFEFTAICLAIFKKKYSIA